ncbi:MAG: SGNH/GDSL hydrolase family protein [Mycobacteriales bacterium]
MRSRLTKTIAVVTIALGALLMLPSGAEAAFPDGGAPPNSMAALGDSITQAFNACGWYYNCSSESWSTGTSSGINSHYLRIQQVNPAIAGHNNNDSVTGAKAVDLNSQAQNAVSQKVQYVTILIGANDACTSSEATMTSVATYRAQINAAMSTLKAGLPSARVFVSSVPDVKRLWEINRYNGAALYAWDTFGICQSMLANATSDSSADAARRDRVQQRVRDFNGQLAAACSAYGSTCRYDGGAVFNYRFVPSQVSGWDYFHPSKSGQTALASVTYAAGFGW